jgi:protein-disulfide isomerase
VIAIFIISGAATTLPMTTLPRRATKDLRTLVSTPVPLLLTLVFAASAAAVLTAFPRDSVLDGEESTRSGSEAQAPAPLPEVSATERAKLAEWWDLQPQVTVPVPSDGFPVVIVKFNDYQCPACKLTHEAYKPVIGKYLQPRRIKYVVKHFPLEGECNTAAAGGNHYAACEAAAGVLMARANGVGSILEDWLFEHLGPPPLTPQQVKDAVRTVGGVLDYDAQFPKMIEQVKADASLGALLNVDSTPTFFINGRRLPKTLVQPQYLDVIIQLELDRAAKTTK